MWKEFDVILDDPNGRNNCDCPINTPIIVKDVFGSTEIAMLRQYGNYFTVEFELGDDNDNSCIESEKHIIEYKIINN